MATVLIVPQDTMISDLIGEFVGAAGHQVVYPTHDESILGRVRKTGARVALVQVEGHDSDEMAIVQHLELAGIPVIVYSGRLIEDELERMATGNAAIAALPTTPRALRQKIDAALAEEPSREPARNTVREKAAEPAHESAARIR